MSEPLHERRRVSYLLEHVKQRRWWDNKYSISRSLPKRVQLVLVLRPRARICGFGNRTEHEHEGRIRAREKSRSRQSSFTMIAVDTVKLKLTIAYDGSNYAGWQVQKTGLGVQQKIEEVLARFFPSASRL